MVTWTTFFTCTVLCKQEAVVMLPVEKAVVVVCSAASSSNGCRTRARIVEMIAWQVSAWLMKLLSSCLDTLSRADRLVISFVSLRQVAVQRALRVSYIKRARACVFYTDDVTGTHGRTRRGGAVPHV